MNFLHQASPRAASLFVTGGLATSGSSDRDRDHFVASAASTASSRLPRPALSQGGAWGDRKVARAWAGPVHTAHCGLGSGRVACAGPVLTAHCGLGSSRVACAGPVHTAHLWPWVRQDGVCRASSHGALWPRVRLAGVRRASTHSTPWSRAGQLALKVDLQQ